MKAWRKDPECGCCYDYYDRKAAKKLREDEELISARVSEKRGNSDIWTCPGKLIGYEVRIFIPTEKVSSLKEAKLLAEKKLNVVIKALKEK